LYKFVSPFRDFSIESLIKNVSSLLKDFKYLFKNPPLKSLSSKPLLLIKSIEIKAK
jgi:hypothetical protein